MMETGSSQKGRWFKRSRLIMILVTVSIASIIIISGFMLLGTTKDEARLVVRMGDEFDYWCHVIETMGLSRAMAFVNQETRVP